MSRNARPALTIAGLAAGWLLSLSSTSYVQGTVQQRSACMGDALRFCMVDIPNVTQIEGMP